MIGLRVFIRASIAGFFDVAEIERLQLCHDLEPISYIGLIISATQKIS